MDGINGNDCTTLRGINLIKVPTVKNKMAMEYNLKITKCFGLNCTVLHRTDCPHFTTDP